jgi:hypothetical protein
MKEENPLLHDKRERKRKKIKYSAENAHTTRGII